MQRMGLCIGVKAAAIADYKRVHAAVWPEVLDVISRANIRNYSIFLREPENLQFASWEYHGSDFATDSALMGESPAMRKWWELCDPMQTPLPTRADGEWWAAMERVFHLD
ncbi:L-rhamnose mutarotase [Mesorhizobium sp.]|uniref:L-rhamnose mutarotase n=1 Tax=Mesorhizobium sp. TaxID=1871066 RepID=UPI000FE8AF0E|nr:L-rhamnose mutarotase [Mesorhizobium sp.]RWC50659.1 MAG: L-rhamnose mutarotase [Mesorhizobium sp.]RWC62487.1 MAG: L-rhamnose mutarotase [Mesorhizobium sp.]RWC63931.1 MAG: L-rhamnose mutarotase [Mesorhizobium sp.]